MTDRHCHRCGTSVSMFWYPFAFGVGRDDEGQACGGQVYELCDRCAFGFVRFMQEPMEGKE